MLSLREKEAWALRYMQMTVVQVFDFICWLKVPQDKNETKGIRLIGFMRTGSSNTVSEILRSSSTGNQIHCFFQGTYL